MGDFWSAHTHSKFSAKDAMPEVGQIIAKAGEYGYEALGLTDHGNMAGAAQLYTGCKKAGINPLPGIEMYLAYDRMTKDAPKTVHFGMLATTERGYRNLVGLTTQAHKQYRYKPIIDLADLAEAAEDGRLDGIAATTGCWFGLISETLKRPMPDVDKVVDNLLASLSGWFGSGLYLEIQNHAVYKKDQDSDQHAAVQWAIAQRHGLPVVITQDSHYLDADEQPIHDTMKRLVSWSNDPDEAVFPGDGYHMADDDWMREHHTPEVYAAGIAGLKDLASKAKVVIPELDKFSLKVPDTTATGKPDKELEKQAAARLEELLEAGTLPKAKAKAYRERIAEELDVINSSGFAGYLLFTAGVCDFMRQNTINFNIRGSASGSLLCWLIGITSLDPIEWGLRFDRFLSRDRTKPPDIDIDVEHDRRDEVVGWLRENFHVVNIGTWAVMATSQEEGADQKGSLVIKWKMAQRKLGLDPNARISPKEWGQLEALSQRRTFSGYGVHAAGLLVTPDEATAAVVPLQYVASSKTMITQFDKDDVEKFGLVKLDLLGLKTLTALRIMRELTGIDPADIPLNDKKVYQAIGKGETTGMFQLDGGSARSGVRKLKPTKIGDIIAAMALFRPATQQSGATEDYIQRRQGYTKVPERHGIIAAETKDTYGVLLYQEQAIGVLRALGMTPEEIEKARKAIKASNAADGGSEMTAMLGRIRELAKKQGMNFEDIAWLEQALEAYAGYGFNKAHATAYGVLAYVTGWFSINEPVAYWAGMLHAYTGTDDENDYLIAARAAGVKVWSAHVNKSNMGYTADMDTGTIRKGLTSIKGVGDKAAEELVRHAPYESLQDLARKVSAKRVTGAKALGQGHRPEACGGVIAALHDAMALEGLEMETLA